MSAPFPAVAAAPAGRGDLLDRLIELARWAPSGDNAQPWRFRRLDAWTLRLDTRDQSAECLYERDGRCGLLSIGALLESLRLAAGALGCRIAIRRLDGGRPLAPSFAVALTPDPAAHPDPLSAHLRQRSVHRGAYSGRALTPAEAETLRTAVGPAFRLRLEGGRRRWRWAALNQRAALLRLDTREGWELMGRIIEWDARFSADRLPDRALGLPGWMLGPARSQLVSWRRTRLLNRWLLGTWMPRLLLDWWPGLRCGAHLALEAVLPDDSAEGWLRAGAAVQRLWLAATGLGLQHQPGMTPLIFARYARDGIAFSGEAWAAAAARRLAGDLERLLGAGALERTVWIGRIGAAPPAAARSLRLAADALCPPTAADGRA